MVSHVRAPVTNKTRPLLHHEESSDESKSLPYFLHNTSILLLLTSIASTMECTTSSRVAAKLWPEKMLTKKQPQLSLAS